MLSWGDFILMVDQEGVRSQLLEPGQSGSTAHLGVELKGLWEEQQELF